MLHMRGWGEEGLCQVGSVDTIQSRRLRLHSAAEEYDPGGGKVNECRCWYGFQGGMRVDGKYSRSRL